MASTNRQIHLISRPNGTPSLKNFTLHTSEIPTLKDNEVLVRSLYLSVDPYMRGRIGGRPSSHPPFPINQPSNGDGVGYVVESKHPDFKRDDRVAGFLDWADYSVMQGSSLLHFDASRVSPTAMLSVLGMPALTAYFGLLEIGSPKPNETVVISGAAGAVGMIVGKIAKIKGCHVIGITGTDAKVDYLLQELRFDAAINYKKSDWISALQSACPKGLDIYFDNVGGDITDTAMQHLNRHARIVLCGRISSYNLEQPNIGPRPFRNLIVKSAKAQGFLVYDYLHRFPEGRKQLQEWLTQGHIKPCETIAQGLENMPRAFLGLFCGDNLGKQLVQV